MYTSEIDRLLASRASCHLTEVFVTEWLTLNEIDMSRMTVPKTVRSNHSQSISCTICSPKIRPLLESIDSNVAFINPHTSRSVRSRCQANDEVRQTEGD